MITNEKRVCTKEVAELIILRHLGILKEMDKFELKLNVGIRPIDRNKADFLTRVRKR